MKDQKKIGILLSYLNLILGILINIVVTPILIVTLSDSAYSIYKVMQSFAGPIIMLNLGFATIVARAVAKYRATADEDSREKENVFATAIIISVMMAALAVIIGIVMLFQVPALYGSTYSPDEIRLAQKIMMVFVCSTAVHILSDPFKGSVIGNEQFAFYYGIQTAHHVLKIVLILVFLNIGMGALSVAMVDLINNVMLLFGNAIFSRFVMKERPKVHYIDKREIRGIFTFSVAILLQTIVNQINNSMDVVILGAMVIEKEVITMYSSALTIYTVYNSLISVFSNIFFPQATRLIAQEHTSEQLTDFVIGPGRLQAIIAVAVVAGFGLFGKDFISLWIGEKYIDAYYVVMILIVPVSIPLVQNVCITILDAKLKRLFRSVVLVVMALINLGASVLLVRYIGFWGAALGTAASLMIGHVIIMNIYYSRVIGIQVMRMFRGIFKGILPMGIISVLICLPLTLLPRDHILLFILKCMIFVVVYLLLLWKWGMNEDDKRFIIKKRNG